MTNNDIKNAVLMAVAEKLNILIDYQDADNADELRCLWHGYQLLQQDTNIKW